MAAPAAIALASPSSVDFERRLSRRRSALAAVAGLAIGLFASEAIGVVAAHSATPPGFRCAAAADHTSSSRELQLSQEQHCHGDGHALLQLPQKRLHSLVQTSLTSASALLHEDHVSKCETVLLTTFLTSRPDPQHPTKNISTGFEYIETYYNSVLSVPGGRVRSIVLHDHLPEDVTETYSTADGVFSFQKVNISRFDPKLGLNDLRFQLFDEQIKAHPTWETVFMTDVRDVSVEHNPCALVARTPEKLFVGSEPDTLTENEWMIDKFTRMMGGKYLEWFQHVVPRSFRLLNAGIVGGRRDVVLAFLDKFLAVMQDPELEALKADRNNSLLDMPALNWVVGNEYDGADVVTGAPLHSVFRLWEPRRDVYFLHK